MALALASCGAKEVTTDRAPRVGVQTSVESPSDEPARGMPPSLAYYPPLHPTLLAGLESGDASAILAGLSRTFAPVKPKYALWERSGHVRLTGTTTGFVREVDGEIAPQLPGRYDLSCAGGFLEAVRLLLLPRVELDELGQCDEALLATVEGAPESCGHRGDFGWLALVNLAQRLPAERLPAGPKVWSKPIRRRGDVQADVGPGHARLCTVSHASATHDGERFHHHMMVMLEADERGEVPLFDITGSRGVYMRPRPSNMLAKYAKHLLADNDAYRYDPGSTWLTCLDVKL